MESVSWWRRTAAVLAIFAAVSAPGVVSGASPAVAAPIGDCSVRSGTPGAPTSLHALPDSDPRYSLLSWGPPLNTILGLDCRPILEYAIWFQDLTEGTGWALAWTSPNTGGGIGPWPNGHTIQFAVHARNTSGWSASYAFTTYTVP